MSSRFIGNLLAWLNFCCYFNGLLSLEVFAPHITAFLSLSTIRTQMRYRLCALYSDKKI